MNKKSILSIAGTLLVWEIISVLVVSLRPTNIDDKSLYTILIVLQAIFVLIVPIVLVAVRKKFKVRSQISDTVIVLIAAFLVQLLDNFPLLFNGVLNSDVLMQLGLIPIAFTIIYIVAEKMMNKQKNAA